MVVHTFKPNIWKAGRLADLFEFVASLGYMVRPCLKNKSNTTN